VTGAKKAPASKLRVAAKRAQPAVKASAKKTTKKAAPARAARPVARSKSSKKR
jgi:hypothetical protein